MHRKTPISLLVYNTLFPAPLPTDPPSFSAHLSKNLVGEVRIETATFYGSLDTIEARYPGLNYAHAPHRKRLGRFPHHAKLFEAFDRLGLTDSEIQGFCRWEGTLWARERYERDEGVKVRDTTGIEIGAWVDRRKWRVPSGKYINVKTDIEVEIAAVGEGDHSGEGEGSREAIRPGNADAEMAESEEEASSEEDGELDVDESVGFALNQRLMHAAAMREQGTSVPMDPEWEQYLKEAQERGDLNADATREALRTMAGQLVQAERAVIAREAAQPYSAPAAPA